MTRQRALIDSVAHASILRPVACTHTMNLLADRALEEGGGTGLQHLVETLTVEVVGTEVQLPARTPIVVHVQQADCALLRRFHRLPLFCVLTQSVRGWRGVCYRVRLSGWWWITSKHGTAEREIVLKEIVKERRIVSSSPNLLWLLTKMSKLLSSEIWNGLLKERLLLDLVACWLSWVPGLEVCRVEADMVLPYVLTQPLKDRAGRKLRVILGEVEGDSDLVARGQSGPVEGKDGLLSHYPHLVAGHH